MTKRDKHFKPENLRSWIPTTYTCGHKYKLEVYKYKQGKPTDHYWDFSRGLVFDGDEAIFDIKRNYPEFIHMFITNHPNGNDYLICGEDYHDGYNVLDLTNRINYAYVPPRADPNEHYEFWCWAYPHSFNPETQELIIDGCYWGAPFERTTFDFSQPDKLPLPELKCEYIVYEDDDDDEEEGE